MNDKIKTRIRQKEKPHDKFRAILQFDSTPTELNIEADATGLDVKDLRRNPRKFSFGKIVARNKNSAEFYMYPLDSMKHAFLSSKKDFSARTSVIVLDSRRIREFINLLMRIRYFMVLSKERRLEYLRKKGFPANIDIEEGTPSA